VKVLWLGQEDGSNVSFSSAKPVLPLNIHDVIPRDCIVYEEPQPGRVQFKKDLSLAKATVASIKAAIPRPLVTNITSHPHDAEPAPSRSVVHNHAGVAIHPNVGPAGAEETSMWAATLEEISGFEWRGEVSVEDPKPPTYRVANIRRDSKGVIYAVVTSSDGDIQYDHSLPTIRRRIHKERVASKVKHLPLMMRYRCFSSASTTIDWGVLLSNAVFYNQVVR